MKISASKKKNQEKQAVSFKVKPMSKQVGEKAIQHRAFLLWAMQSKEQGRSKNKVAKTVGVSATSINNWQKRWDWEERAKNITAETEAHQIYKKIYFPEIGNTELMAMEENISLPKAEKERKVVQASVAETLKENLEETEKKAAVLLEKETKRKHMMLIDAALGYVAQGIKDGEIKRTLRDIPMLLEMREKMSSNTSANPNAIVVESIRVRDAKANNGDIIEAMYQDAEEISAILGALRSRGSVKEIKEVKNDE